jgi:hypothetical protein
MDEVRDAMGGWRVRLALARSTTGTAGDGGAAGDGEAAAVGSGGDD